MQVLYQLKMPSIEVFEVVSVHLNIFGTDGGVEPSLA